MRYWVLLLLGSFIFNSCGYKQPKEGEATYSKRAIHIISNAGEPYLDSSFLASPLIHGVMLNDEGDSLHVMVVGRYCNTDRLEIYPFASFQIIDGDTKMDIVLAFPQRVELKVYPDMDFQEFVIQNNAAKVLIDQYFSNYKGQGMTRVVNWNNAGMAANMIEEFMKPKNI